MISSEVVPDSIYRFDLHGHVVEGTWKETIARWPSDTCSAWAMGIFLSIWSGYEDYDGRGVIGYYGA